MTNYFSWRLNKHKHIVPKRSQINTCDISLIMNKASLKTEHSKNISQYSQTSTTSWEDTSRCLRRNTLTLSSELSSWQRRISISFVAFFNSQSSPSTFSLLHLKLVPKYVKIFSYSTKIWLSSVTSCSPLIQTLDLELVADTGKSWVT